MIANHIINRRKIEKKKTELFHGLPHEYRIIKLRSTRVSAVEVAHFKLYVCNYYERMQYLLPRSIEAAQFLNETAQMRQTFSLPRSHTIRQMN